MILVSISYISGANILKKNDISKFFNKKMYINLDFIRKNTIFAA